MSKITDLDFAVISELCDRHNVDHVKTTNTYNLGNRKRKVEIFVATKDDVESYDWDGKYTRLSAWYSILDNDYKIDNTEMYNGVENGKGIKLLDSI